MERITEVDACPLTGDRPEGGTHVGAHLWWEWDGRPCCRLCGIVRRKDGENKPCRGATKVRLRQRGYVA